jgi:hypothetical protein
MRNRSSLFFVVKHLAHTHVSMHIHRFSLQEIRSPANVFCVAVFYVCTLRRRHMYFVTSRKSSQYENVASFQRKFSSFLYFSLNCEFCKKKYLSKSRKRLQLFVRLLTATSMLRVVMRIRNYWNRIQHCCNIASYKLVKRLHVTSYVRRYSFGTRDILAVSKKLIYNWHHTS